MTSDELKTCPSPHHSHQTTNHHRPRIHLSSPPTMQHPGSRRRPPSRRRVHGRRESTEEPSQQPSECGVAAVDHRQSARALRGEHSSDACRGPRPAPRRAHSAAHRDPTAPGVAALTARLDRLQQPTPQPTTSPTSQPSPNDHPTPSHQPTQKPQPAPHSHPHQPTDSAITHLQVPLRGTCGLALATAGEVRGDHHGPRRNEACLHRAEASSDAGERARGVGGRTARTCARAGRSISDEDAAGGHAGMKSTCPQQHWPPVVKIADTPQTVPSTIRLAIPMPGSGQVTGPVVTARTPGASRSGWRTVARPAAHATTH